MTTSKLLALLGALSTSFGLAFAAPPANDNFANAQALVSGTNFNGTTVDATREPGDPGNNSYSTVWFKWTAPAAGVANVSVASSSTSMNLSTLVDDPPLTGKFIAHDGKSSSFYVIANHIYYICLRDFYESSYEIQLAADTSLPVGTQFTKPLANDYFNQARQFSSAHEDFVFHTLGATYEPFEKDMLRSVGAPTTNAQGGVWADWTAPLTGSATLTARNLGNRSIVLLVGTGTSTSTIMNVTAAAYDGIAFPCQQGIVYHLYFLTSLDGLAATIDATGGGGGSTIQPDSEIGNSAAALRGDNIYNSDGVGQTKKTTLNRGTSHTFFIRVENDGDSADTFVVAGTGNSAGWKVRYSQGQTDITAAVRTGTYVTRSLDPGTGLIIKATVAATAAAPVGAVKVGLVTSTSQTDGAKADTVGFQATAQ